MSLFMSFLVAVSEVVLGILFFMFLSVFMHELGHFKRAERYGCNPYMDFGWKPFRFGIKTDGNETFEQQLKIIESGVWLGLVVVMFSFYILGWWFLWVLAGYIWGVKHDIKHYFMIRRTMKQKKIGV